jgi:hypothetical protein
LDCPAARAAIHLGRGTEKEQSLKNPSAAAREGNNLTPAIQLIDDATSFSRLFAPRFEPQMNSGDFRQATGEQTFGDYVADDLGTKPPTAA